VEEHDLGLVPVEVTDAAGDQRSTGLVDLPAELDLGLGEETADAFLGRAGLLGPLRSGRGREKGQRRFGVSLMCSKRVVGSLGRHRDNIGNDD
jgi:hypothetical protein